MPWSRKMSRGMRLIRNAVRMAATGWGEIPVFVILLFSDIRAGGVIRTTMIIKILELKIRLVEGIATTWICTKGFWFLRPTDRLISFRGWGIWLNYM